MFKRLLTLMFVFTFAVIAGSEGSAWAVNKISAYPFGRVSCGDVHTCAIKPDGAATPPPGTCAMLSAGVVDTREQTKA